MEGFNCCVLAYGQTHSGKSYTMGTSVSDNYDNIGIIPRSLESFFHKIQKYETCDINKRKFKVSIQFLELYGEDIHDLLDNSRKNKLNIRESPDGDVFVPGAQETVIKSTEEAMSLLELGTKHRVTSATNMNNESSRSHGNIF